MKVFWAIFVLEFSQVVKVLNKYDERYKKIGQNIAKYRKEKGLSQEELANEVGISYSYIIQIEAPNVVKKMSLEVLFDIADFLKINVKDLL